MTQPAIKVEGLSKEYIVGHAQEQHGTFYDLLASTLKAPLKRLRNLGGQAQETERFWALHDVSFEVQPGEVVGVIGRNGAGKSTLLKVLSRITAPTKGRIEVRGRLASLLEVGTGFHPELSGRENIFLNGAILGMTRAEVARKFDKIVAFAEIERFIDTPVKRYSSGMYVRLAFAVAAYLEPDILVVDEVLAVGDAEFQKKCLGKMEHVRGEGRTVLVVSHNIQMISQLCRTAIWIDKGRVVGHGEFRDVSSDYLSVRQIAASFWQPEDQDPQDFCYEQVGIHAPQGSTPESIPASQAFRIEFIFAVNRDGLQGRIALQIRDVHGTPILSSSNLDGMSVFNKKWNVGRHVEYCEIPGHLLMPGVYYLTISQPMSGGDAIIENVCSFNIDSSDSVASKDGRAGVIAPLLTWQVVA
jgi:lipopolysaccharide transport system ATP-binding protein